MIEPQEILLKAATDALGEMGSVLRRRGWAVELSADRDEEGTYTVTLRYELPKMKIPVEAQ
jgi:hypothetical protein